MSVTTPSVVLALVAYLSHDPGVRTLVAANAQAPYGYNVYDHELPSAQDLLMPTQAIVVRRHGGPPGPAQLQINYGRYQVLCYGNTMSLADQTYWAAYMALKMCGGTWASTDIKSVIQRSSSSPTRDTVLQWPVTTSLWQVIASDLHPPGSP